MSTVVVALNPSIDAEWRVEAVRWEEKNNVLSERRWAGGKGVNVARWLKHLGTTPQLILPLGGISGRELAACLKCDKIFAKIVPIHESSRVNVIVSTAAQGQMRFNPLGPKLTRAEWQKILARVRVALRQASCLILTGSLPRGLPMNAYTQLIHLARGRKVPVLLDCDGPALIDAVSAKLFLVKPNAHELAQWAVATGRSASLRPAALAMSRITGGWVLVSRGAKSAFLIHANLGIEFTATPPKVKPRNTVGAGDSLLAAVAQQLIRGAPPQAWLRAGLSVASKAVQLPAGQLPSS